MILGKRSMLSLLVFLCILAVTPVTAVQAGTHVDWIGGYVSATARGFAKQTGSPMDRGNAVEAARVIAQADLLEAVKGVKVDRQTAVGELIEERTETAVRVHGVLRNAFQAGEETVAAEGGYVVATVEMRVCLYNEGLACRSDTPLVAVLQASGGRSRPQKNAPACSLAPDIASSREALKKIMHSTAEAMPFFLVNLRGRPVNTESRDFAIGFESEAGEKCTVYAPDRVDPLVRKDRGTVQIFLHEEEGRRQHGDAAIVLKAMGLDRKNYIVVTRNDAYLMNLVNESRKDRPFRDGRVGVVLDD